MCRIIAASPIETSAAHSIRSTELSLIDHRYKYSFINSSRRQRRARTHLGGVLDCVRSHYSSQSERRRRSCAHLNATCRRGRQERANGSTLRHEIHWQISSKTIEIHLGTFRAAVAVPSLCAGWSARLVSPLTFTAQLLEDRRGHKLDSHERSRAHTHLTIWTVAGGCTSSRQLIWAGPIECMQKQVIAITHLRRIDGTLKTKLNHQFLLFCWSSRINRSHPIPFNSILERRARRPIWTQDERSSNSCAESCARPKQLKLCNSKNNYVAAARTFTAIGDVKMKEMDATKKRRRGEEQGRDARRFTCADL